MPKTRDSLSDLRYLGVEIIGQTLWDTHICDFYARKQGLSFGVILNADIPDCIHHPESEVN